ncbi:MAG TPA: ATP-grasp domain-containing protein, partial [Desulfobacteraceae bacterium]|nr:ATP-grasp domain-containing protein [Desulfobacteraceae bacterium]
EEILCDLSNYHQVTKALKKHLAEWRLPVDGIACFDCESMELSSVIAEFLDLPYPSVDAIGKCRDKFASKAVWSENGLKTPCARLIRSREEASSFFHDINGPCVLKPLSGSGSELVFCCRDGKTCERAFIMIDRGIGERQEKRIYRLGSPEQPRIIAEEYIQGIEFSCDFIIEDSRVELIRLTRKIHSFGGPLGTIRGYVLADSLPEGIKQNDFLQIIGQAARALGVCRAICMLDFIVRDREIVLLELTPRPGGDCLPFLLRRAWNFDMLASALDFARRRPIMIQKPLDFEPYIGLRLHAKRGGVLGDIDAGLLEQDERVCEIFLPRSPGHVIRMPPEDYDSWLLGHVIFNPYPEPDFETQCNQLSDCLMVRINQKGIQAIYRAYS